MAELIFFGLIGLAFGWTAAFWTFIVLVVFLVIFGK